MIATAFDPSLGGRDFDRAIMDAMRNDFKQRYRLDAYSQSKAKLRLRAECEKAKKSMSSNVQPIPISLECFMDDKDVSGKMSRSEFEELIKPLLNRIRRTLEHLLKEASRDVRVLRDVRPMLYCREFARGIRFGRDYWRFDTNSCRQTIDSRCFSSRANDHDECR
jgi:molecular chaperone DnaK (HSP70)